MLRPLLLALAIAWHAGAARAQPSPAAPRFDRSAAGADLPFSPAVQVGDVLYLSGQIGSLPGTTKLAPGGLAGQARQAMDNIGAVLRLHGLSFADLFKCTIMLTDMTKWSDFNAVYLGYFDRERRPARSAFGAKGLALGAEVEVECWAHAPARR